MAKTSKYLIQLEKVTTIDLQNMTKPELEKLAVGSSKRIAANIRNLRTSDYALDSRFLSERSKNDAFIKLNPNVVYEGTSTPKKLSDYTHEERVRNTIPVTEIKPSVASKLSKTQLINQITNLAYVNKLETSSLNATKKYTKKIISSFGKRPRDVTSQEWERLRMLYAKAIKMGLSSEDINTVYDSRFSDDTIIEMATIARDAKNERLWEEEEEVKDPWDIFDDNWFSK